MDLLPSELAGKTRKTDTPPSCLSLWEMAGYQEREEEKQFYVPALSLPFSNVGLSISLSLSLSLSLLFNLAHLTLTNFAHREQFAPTPFPQPAPHLPSHHSHSLTHPLLTPSLSSSVCTNCSQICLPSSLLSCAVML